jgi:metal-responsive CopG/Arc/MetJ family transcriptional regulator
MPAGKENAMGTVKVKLDKDLVDKVKKFAQLSGYASTEEFIAHCLEKEISKVEGADSEEEIKKKLKGLGYIS